MFCCRHHWVRVGSTIGLTTLYSTGSGEERTPALYVLTDHCSWSLYTWTCMCGCCSNDKAVSWKKPWADVELGLWSMLSTAAVVKTLLNACGGHSKPSVKNLAHTVLATSVEIGKTPILWNAQAQIISAIYESMFPCLHELSWQYILGEVFLYSNCDIYDTQTTTNQLLCSA